MATQVRTTTINGSVLLLQKETSGTTTNYVVYKDAAQQSTSIYKTASMKAYNTLKKTLRG